jgi:hypothetical protein
MKCLHLILQTYSGRFSSGEHRASRDNHGLAKPSPAGVGCWRVRARVANFHPRAISTRSGLLLAPARVFFSPLAGPAGCHFRHTAPLPPPTELQVSPRSSFLASDLSLPRERTRPQSRHFSTINNLLSTINKPGRVPFPFNLPEPWPLIPPPHLRLAKAPDPSPTSPTTSAHGLPLTLRAVFLSLSCSIYLTLADPYSWAAPSEPLPSTRSYTPFECEIVRFVTRESAPLSS